MHKIPSHKRQQLAKELSENELLPVIIGELKQEYFDTWISEQNGTKRDLLWTKTQVLDDVEAGILAAINGEG